MNTTTPDKCPVCKAVRAASEYAGAYKCGTMVSSSGKFHHTVTCHYFAELRKPLDTERDQLAERVRMLEARLADHNEAAACAVIQDESAFTRPSDADLRAAFDGIVEPVGTNTIRVPAHVAAMLKEMDTKASKEEGGVSKTAGTPFTRITRDEAAALWASNGEVWAMLNCDLRPVVRLNPRDRNEAITWSVQIIEDGQAVFYVRG